MGQKLELSGRRFGRFLVLNEGERTAAGKITWACRCDCGATVVVLSASLTSGNTRSCGCLQKEETSARRKTHGGKGSRGYRIWANMLTRCRNPNSSKFADYGGRGITVCEAWTDFGKFIADMGQPPDGFSIDRIDNDKGYEPANCRWADHFTQANNRRPRTNYPRRNQEGKFTCTTA